MLFKAVNSRKILGEGGGGHVLWRRNSKFGTLPSLIHDEVDINEDLPRLTQIMVVALKSSG